MVPKLAERPDKGKPAVNLPSQKPRLPRAIWILGCVSLLMDVSSKLIHALLPLSW